MMELKDRIQYLIDYKHLSIPKFADAVGVRTPQAIRELLKGNTKSISADMQHKILSYIPELNAAWLIAGQGKPFKYENNLDMIRESKDDPDLIPLLPVEAMAGTLQGLSEGVELANCRKIKSPVKGADWAIQISGDSMEPDYKNGSYLYIRKMTGTFIPWGQTMVIDTLDGVVVKDIYPLEDAEEYIEARSINKKYPPFRIEKSIILGIYRVLGGSFINSTI